MCICIYENINCTNCSENFSYDFFIQVDYDTLKHQIHTLKDKLVFVIIVYNHKSWVLRIRWVFIDRVFLNESHNYHFSIMSGILPKDTKFENLWISMFSYVGQHCSNGAIE